MKPFSRVPAHALLSQVGADLIHAAKLVISGTGLLAILLSSFSEQAASQSGDRPALAAANDMPVQSSIPTLQATVQEVPLVLSVTDHKGKYVDNPVQADLKIFDNDREQTAITFFEHQTNLPLNVAMVVDVSNSVAQRFMAEQGTIRSFIRTVARPSDSVNIFAFNEGVKFVAKVNNNWNEIAHRIKKPSSQGKYGLVRCAG